MGILEAWHPDIEKFVSAKTKPGVFENTMSV
jgi:ribonucleoside-diphosphate reductase alpha chain